MLGQMRTTLNVDDNLMGRVRRAAAARGLTLTALVEEALRELLESYEATPPTVAFDMPVVEGRRPPAADLADRDTLYEYLEGRR